MARTAFCVVAFEIFEIFSDASSHTRFRRFRENDTTRRAMLRVIASLTGRRTLASSTRILRAGFASDDSARDAPRYATFERVGEGFRPRTARTLEQRQERRRHLPRVARPSPRRLQEDRRHRRLRPRRRPRARIRLPRVPRVPHGRRGRDALLRADHQPPHATLGGVRRHAARHQQS